MLGLGQYLWRMYHVSVEKVWRKASVLSLSWSMSGYIGTVRVSVDETEARRVSSPQLSSVSGSGGDW